MTLETPVSRAVAFTPALSTSKWMIWRRFSKGRQLHALTMCTFCLSIKHYVFFGGERNSPYGGTATRHLPLRTLDLYVNTA